MNRDLFIDKIKGAAIILVIWGHCIQYCANYDVYSNKLFQLIYSFHMPFFMAVSGYLYYFSLNRKNLKELIVSRIKQLLIPLLIWSLVYLLAFWWNVSHSLVQWVKNYIYTLPLFFWFIWSLLLCSIITIGINKLFKDSLLAYFIVFIILILLPNGLGFFYTKYMIPYFFAGYLVHKYNLKSNTIAFIISFIVFAILLYNWKFENYIYTTTMATKLTDFKGIYDDCYRYIAGFTGILVFLTLIRKLPDLKLFEVLGKHTLGIYILGSFFNSFLHLLGLHYQPFLYNFIYTPFLTCVIIGISVGLSMLISKSKILNMCLLGGR